MGGNTRKSHTSISLILQHQTKAFLSLTRIHRQAIEGFVDDLGGMQVSSAFEFGIQTARLLSKFQFSQHITGFYMQRTPKSTLIQS